MKYILTAAILTLALTACTDKNPETKTAMTQDNASMTETTTTDMTANAPVDQVADAVKTINFTGPQDLTIALKTTDDFETAQLTDNSGKTHDLKRVVSGSGIKLANDNGVSIHFKDFNGVMEGTVELVKDKGIEIKEFKAS